MIDDADTQRLERQHTTEIPTTPRFAGVLVTHVRESSSLSESTRVDEDSNHNTTIHRFSEGSEVSLGLNATVSSAEKSFKREDYIYVSFFFGLFTSGSSK
jgi:hypothetical protein